MTVDAAWSSNAVNLPLDREGNASSRAEFLEANDRVLRFQL